MDNRLIFLYRPVCVEARGDGEGQRSRLTVVTVQARRRASYDEKVRPLTPRGDDVAARPEVRDPMLPRKSPRGADEAPVPQTDTGGRGENPKALERTLVKELCKLTP